MNLMKSFMAFMLVLGAMSLTPQASAAGPANYNTKDPNVPSLESLRGTMTGTAAFGTPEQRGRLPEDQTVETCDTCLTLQHRFDGDMIEPLGPVQGSSGRDSGTGSSGGTDNTPGD